MKSTHEVEKEIKAAVYLTKQSKSSQTSGINSQLSLEKKGELNLLVSCDKCAKVFVYNEQIWHLCPEATYLFSKFYVFIYLIS